MPSLTHTQHAGIVTLRLQRPTLNEGLITALLHHLSVLENHRSARLLVLGSTAGQFGQGLDPELPASALAPLAALLRLLRQLSVPTVALLEGEVRGCATALAACCDLRLASPDSGYGWGEANLAGQTLPLTLAVLHQQLGPGAWPYLLRGDRLDAHAAQMAGLVHGISNNLTAELDRWQAGLQAGSVTKTELLRLRTESFKENSWVECSARLWSQQGQKP